MPKVPRDVLKQYFQTGDMPTQAQFGVTLDSMVNFVDDRDFIGLRTYNPASDYLPGDCAVFNDQVVKCITATTGTFKSADWTVLAAFGSVSYAGTWDTQNNVPFLESSVGTKGFYYVVINASSDPNDNTTLNGINDWGTTDWAIYNGTAWEKVDNSTAPVEAIDVSYVPSGNLSSTNVQDAIDELEAEKQPLIKLKTPAIPYASGTSQFSESSFKQQSDGVAIDLRMLIRSEISKEAQIDFGTGGDEVKLSTSGSDPVESRLLLSPKDARLLGEIITIQQNDTKSMLQLKAGGNLSLSNNGGSGTDCQIEIQPGKLSVSHATYGFMAIDAGADSNGQTRLSGASNLIDITKDSVTISNVWGPGASIDLDSSGIISAEATQINLDAVVNLPSLTASTVPVIDGSKNIVSSSVTESELNNMSGVTSPIQAQLNTKLSTSGGTMTGDLILNADPTVALGAVTKQYADALAALKLNLSGGTMTGDLILNANPTVALGAATMQYVDSADASLQAQLNTKLSTSGGTMSGDLILNADPTAALGAVTKQYVDAINTALTTAVNTKVSKAGDTMTGLLTLSADPTSALNAATKQYVDNATKKLLIPFTFDNDYATGSATFTSVPLQVIVPDAADVFPGATTITAKLSIDYMTESGGTNAEGEAGLTEWTTPTSGSPSLISGSAIPMAATADAWTKATSTSAFTITPNRSYRVIFRKTAGSGGTRARIEAASLLLFYS